MIIVTSLPRVIGFDAISIWPFIFITPGFSKDRALLDHELVHYREQRAWLVLPWFLLYLCSKSFRFRAEVRGHAAQISNGGCTLEWAAAYIAKNYHTGKALNEIEQALRIAVS